MRRRAQRAETGIRVAKMLALPAAAGAVVLCFAMALESLDQGRAQEGQDQLEQALRKGCVACYAAEGAYPQNLDYLKDHYGVQVDDERYIVHYEIYGENLMPNITVLER